MQEMHLFRILSAPSWLNQLRSSPEMDRNPPNWSLAAFSSKCFAWIPWISFPTTDKRPLGKESRGWILVSIPKQLHRQPGRRQPSPKWWTTKTVQGRNDIRQVKTNVPAWTKYACLGYSHTRLYLIGTLWWLEANEIWLSIELYWNRVSRVT